MKVVVKKNTASATSVFGDKGGIKMKCSICEGEIEKKYTSEGEMYWDKGENAWPVTDGRCCGICNHEHVIPKRLYEHMRAMDNNEEEE